MGFATTRSITCKVSSVTRARYSTGSGRIVGHIQLQPADLIDTAVPAAVTFQVASAITLQYYLQRFDDRLAEISHSVRKAREDAAWARIARAALEAAEIAEVLQQEGSLSADLRARLDTEEREVDVVALQEIAPVIEAARDLRAVRAEIDEALAAAEAQSRVSRSTSVLRETLPGGLRHRLRDALAAVEAAMVHWLLAARAAQVHATLRSLRAVADRAEDRSWSAAARTGLLDRAAAQAALGTELLDLLALPQQTWSLFTIDAPIASRIESVSKTAGWLKSESEDAAERLGIAAGATISELTLAMRAGQVFALPPLKAA